MKKIGAGAYIGKKTEWMLYGYAVGSLVTAIPLLLFLHLNAYVGILLALLAGLMGTYFGSISFQRHYELDKNIIEPFFKR